MGYMFTIFDKESYITQIALITNIDREIISDIVDTYLGAVLEGKLSFPEASSNIETAIYNNLFQTKLAAITL